MQAGDNTNIAITSQTVNYIIVLFPLIPSFALLDNHFIPFILAFSVLPFWPSADHLYFYFSKHIETVRTDPPQRPPHPHLTYSWALIPPLPSGTDCPCEGHPSACPLLPALRQFSPLSHRIFFLCWVFPSAYKHAVTFPNLSYPFWTPYPFCLKENSQKDCVTCHLLNPLLLCPLVEATRGLHNFQSSCHVWSSFCLAPGTWPSGYSVLFEVHSSGLQNTVLYLLSLWFFPSHPFVFSLLYFLSFPWWPHAVLWLLILYVVNSQLHIPLVHLPDSYSTVSLAFQLECLIDLPHFTTSSPHASLAPAAAIFVLPSSQLQCHLSWPKPYVTLTVLFLSYLTSNCSATSVDSNFKIYTECTHGCMTCAVSQGPVLFCCCLEILNNENKLIVIK